MTPENPDPKHKARKIKLNKTTVNIAKEVITSLQPVQTLKKEKMKPVISVNKKATMPKIAAKKIKIGAWVGVSSLITSPRKININKNM